MNDRIEELLAELIERREGGEVLGAEAFLAEHPEGGEPLREAVLALSRVEGMFPEPTDLHGTPERIGPYRVLADLGRGGMGRVFRVVHEDDPGQELALKQLHPLIAASPRALERFRREGAVLAGLDHEGIVEVRAIDTEAAPPHLVMELVEGSSLARRIAEARERLAGGESAGRALELPGEGPSCLRAARIVLHLAVAVDAAHAQGLLHRDLKPANAILRPDGRPVLIDFGLAAQEESATLTVSGDLLGTPHYMAPEQARGERADPRADVYGLGAVLYEMLALRPPHPGREPLEVLQHILHRPVSPVRRANPEVPRALATVVRRALAWKRERRYPSAGALARDLEAVLEDRSPTASTPGPIERAEDLLRYHPRRAVGFGVALLLLILLPLLPGGSPAARTARQARALRESTLAWVAEDRAALAAAIGRLEGLVGGSPRAAYLRARAEGRSPDATGDEAVDALSEGGRLLERGEAEGAVEAFTRAAELAPDWALPVLLLGRAALAAGDPELAERELTAAARLLPESTALALELAGFHLDRERLEEAERELDRALGGDSESWRAWALLGEVRAKMRRPDAALEAIVRAMQLVPEPRPKLLNLYAATVDRLGDHERARGMFREMLADHPRSATLHFNMGYSYDLECRLPEARAAYLRALELDPRGVRTLSSLANLAAGSNRAECERCQRAFEADPDLYDPDEAVRLTVRAIEVDRCETSWVPDFAAGVARRIDDADGIAAALREVIEGAEVDQRVVRVERALRRIAEQ